MDQAGGKQIITFLTNVCVVLVHKMGEGEWSAYSRAGRGTYFKFWSIGRELFSKGTLKREGR